LPEDPPPAPAPADAVPVPEPEDEEVEAAAPAPKPKPSVPYRGIVDFPPAPYTQALNVRTGPGTNYAVLMVLPEGSRVTVVGVSGSWAQLKAGGWASTSYIKRV